MLALEVQGPIDVVAAWLANYLVHSTLLLLAAWGLSKALAGRAVPGEEWAWRAAMLGGLATATLQLAWGGPVSPGRAAEVAAPAAVALPAVEGASLAPRLAALQVAGPGRAQATDLGTAIDEDSEAAPHGGRILPAPVRPAASARAVGSAGTAEQARPLQAPPRAAIPAWAGGFSPWLVAFWIAGALASAAVEAVRWLRFRRRLAGRRGIAGGPLPAVLARLAALARLPRPVRLSVLRCLPVPFARGLVRPEICLPQRALERLAPEHQEGILAHEVAHLARRDPLWLAAVRLLEGLLFLQPLNRLARRRLAELAEYRCDDWAARATGRGPDLARCLAEVAGWLVGRPALLPVAGMAGRRSSLARRIERLLAGRPERAERAPRWLLPAAVAVLAVVAAAAPGITVAGDPAGPTAAEAAVLAEEAPAPTAPSTPAALAPAAPRPPSPLPAPAAPAPPRVPSPPPAPAALAPPAAPAPPRAPSPPPAPAAPAAPRTPAPKPHFSATVHELFALAAEMSRLARLGEPPAERVARLRERAARAAWEVGSISAEERDRLVAESRAAAAEDALSPRQLGELALETRALAEALAHRPPRTPRPGRPFYVGAGEWGFSDEARREVERRVEREIEAAHRALEQARMEAVGPAMEAARRQSEEALAHIRADLERQRLRAAGAAAAAERQALTEAQEHLRQAVEERARATEEVGAEIARRQEEVQREVRQRLREALDEPGGGPEREALERALAAVRDHLERELGGLRTGPERELERARRELERVQRELAQRARELERVQQEIERAHRELERVSRQPGRGSRPEAEAPTPEPPRP